MNKNFKPLSIAVIIILVAALLVVNCAAIFVPRLYTEINMTSTGMYDISAETKQFLSKLDKKVDICILNADGSNLNFERFVKKYFSDNEACAMRAGKRSFSEIWTRKEAYFKLIGCGIGSDMHSFDTEEVAGICFRTYDIEGFTVTIASETEAEIYISEKK